MPKRALTDPEGRRELILAALAGEPVTKLAAEYGVSRQLVWRLKDEATKTYEEELAFWRRVKNLIEGVRTLH